MAISTSGNSENILHAIAACKDLGIAVAGRTGQLGGKMKDICDHCLCVPSASTPRIQECHMIIEHTICVYIETALFGKGRP